VTAFFVWLFSSKGWAPAERRRLVVVAALFAGSCVFWAVFEQAGNTLTLFAEEKTENAVFGRTFPSSWWQSVNAVLIVLLAPLFAWMWARMGDFDRSSMIRFSIGILFAGLGFAVLIGGAVQAGDAGRASPFWLLSVYLLHTIGELCLSPVGLSSMTKLSPQRVQGLMLGVWFLSVSVGTFLGSQVASVYEQYSLPTLFAAVAVTAVVMAAIMAALIRPVSKLVGGQP
jgi:POT family proton-dependent oligopeptide transporter